MLAKVKSLAVQPTTRGLPLMMRGCRCTRVEAVLTRVEAVLTRVEAALTRVEAALTRVEADLPPPLV